MITRKEETKTLAAVLGALALFTAIFLSAFILGSQQQQVYAARHNLDSNSYAEGSGFKTVPIARDVLDTQIDKTLLNGIIALEYKENDFTKESYQAYKQALEEAKRVSALDAATQEDVNEAGNKLLTAIAGLEAAEDVSAYYIIAVICFVILINVLLIITLLVLRGKRKKEN